MYRTSIVLIFFGTFSVVSCSKLVLILMDGFRWDYFDHMNLPGFAKMAKDGVRAKYMTSDYPTLSYPNYYTIMTGLHTESHGMVGNFMHDTTENKNFLIGTNQDQYLPFWWDDAEPLWVTAEKQGKKSYFFYWPGCEVTIRKTKPTFCATYKLTLVPEFDYSLQQTLGLLQNNSADLIGIYLEAPDYYGHRFGVNSTNLTSVLDDTDNLLNNFRQNLTSLGLGDDVNIMIFSDHGMTKITERVNITEAIELNDIDVILSSTPYTSIWPMEGKLDKVYNDLLSANFPNITIYKKESIPASYYLKNHRRTAPIVIEAHNGVAIVSPWKCSGCEHNKPGTTYVGMHGYNNSHSDMRAIFTATGPAFKKNIVSQPIRNIELYQVMCHILGLEPQANNGTWSNVEDMLVKTDTSTGRSVTISLILLTIAITTSALSFVFC